jgi:hypothetical protein
MTVIDSHSGDPLGSAATTRDACSARRWAWSRSQRASSHWVPTSPRRLRWVGDPLLHRRARRAARPERRGAALPAARSRAAVRLRSPAGPRSRTDRLLFGAWLAFIGWFLLQAARRPRRRQRPTRELPLDHGSRTSARGPSPAPAGASLITVGGERLVTQQEWPMSGGDPQKRSIGTLKRSLSSLARDIRGLTP